MAFLSFLDKERAVAGPGYSRWMIPPAALAIHLSIGQVYSFSVFKTPLTKLPGNWSDPSIAWVFSIAIAVLGVSAAVFGKWLDRNGPRRAMFYSATCFGAGFLVAAVGVHFHQLWLLYLGYGVLGGFGLGLGYIAPVSTLIKWFIDRPGLATGLAIMGFGGGALIGGPLARTLMDHAGVAGAFAFMGVIYFCFMMFGTFAIRTPPPGWKPDGYVPKQKASGMISTHNVDVGTAVRTPQFYLLWLVLCLNTTAGIGIIEQAAPMITELFKGRVGVEAATGFVGFLSLFNMGGRFVWSGLSDYIGRKWTFAAFFLIGVPGYIAITFTGSNHLDSVPFFVLFCGVMISVYGGGFSTMPAFVKDLFGPENVSPIYGRILTAWAAAGVLGPQLVNGIRKYELAHGATAPQAYGTVLHVMAGLLAAGLACDLLLRPVNSSRWETGPSSQPQPAHA
jgi:MFS family permease